MDRVPIERGPVLTVFRRYTWWTLTGTTTVLLSVIVGVWVLDPDEPLAARVVVGVALAVTVAASAVLLSHRLARPPTDGAGAASGSLPMAWLVVGGAGAAVVGGVLLAARDYGRWSYPPATILSIAATFLPTRHRWTVIAGAAAGAAILGAVVAVTSGDNVVFAAVFPAGMIGSIAWGTVGVWWSWDVAERLNEARRLSAELAVKDERLRFAADLHDIQGHHLQVIALKSELAARLAEADPVRAAAEMKEVQRLSTDALRDTRAVVQGYRRTSLDVEIANAAKVLAAADIEVRVNVDPPAGAGTDRLDERSRHLLGLVMREATTNVLRHSQARQAEVDYGVTDGFVRLQIRNDGAVGRSTGTAGSGLLALAERVEAAGGELTWEHDGDRFVVTASLQADGDARAS
ncbi:MAG TPA: histidine kinase [Acidimicrobiales bacterium]|nr:histidine kinase [Acidimicrobiales bacterium]